MKRLKMADFRKVETDAFVMCHNEERMTNFHKICSSTAKTETYGSQSFASNLHAFAFLENYYSDFSSCLVVFVQNQTCFLLKNSCEVS